MKRIGFIVLMLAVLLLNSFAEASLPGLPSLSELYPEQNIQLTRVNSGKDKRYSSRLGPGREYAGGGGFESRKQGTVTAFFREGFWVFTHIIYKNDVKGERDHFVYFERNNFVNYKHIPEIGEIEYIEGKTSGYTVPKWGPASDYADADSFSIAGSTPIKAFFQENNYVYAEFSCAEGNVRMWLPEETITLSDRSGAEPTPVIPPPPTSAPKAKGEGSWSAWSDWSDNPVEPNVNREVETRILYRRKLEIEDWTDWIDGDAPSNGEIVETRTVVGSDGITRNQWRSYGYHYHYGDWTAWSENYWDNVASSSDIVDQKTQYRYRTR